MTKWLDLLRQDEGRRDMLSLKLKPWASFVDGIEVAPNQLVHLEHVDFRHLEDGLQ